MRKLSLTIACLALASCAGTTQIQTAENAWNGTKTAIGIYLVESHASAATVQTVAKAEASIDAEIAGLAALSPPKTAAQVVTDIEALVADLPAGVVPAQDAALVQLAEALTADVEALLPGQGVVVAAPAAAKS